MQKYILSFLIVSVLASCSESKTDPAKKNETSESSSNDTAQVVLNNSDQESWPMKFYSGLIDGQYEIMMMLQNEAGVITGKYFYLNHKKPIDLKGSANGKTLNLNEFYGNKSTGSWQTENFNSEGFEGKWTGKNKHFEFALEAITENEYREGLNSDPKKYNIKQFKEVLALFELKSLPFKLTHSTEEGELDTLNYQTFFEPDFIFNDDFGYNDVFPGMRYETGFGHALIVYRYFTPGAFGINNTFITLYTFDKKGNRIDSEELGCHCHDTNLGANDYYATDAEIEFFEGFVHVKSTDTHGTMFIEELEEGEEEIWEETIVESRFNILDDGSIKEIKLEREHPE